MKPEQLKTIRLALGFSQQKFADMIGATQVTMSRWDMGASPPTGAYLRALIELEKKTISKRGKQR
jgi:DNA-binding transcriptional regulator YiaG